MTPLQADICVHKTRYMFKRGWRNYVFKEFDLSTGTFVVEDTNSILYKFKDIGRFFDFMDKGPT